jgi:hypothetical protein
MNKMFDIKSLFGPDTKNPEGVFLEEGRLEQVLSDLEEKDHYEWRQCELRVQRSRSNYEELSFPNEVYYITKLGEFTAILQDDFEPPENFSIIDIVKLIVCPPYRLNLLDEDGKTVGSVGGRRVRRLFKAIHWERETDYRYRFRDMIETEKIAS